VASGDTYTPWDERDAASQGERGFGYFGSQSDRDNDRPSTELDRSPILPTQWGGPEHGSAPEPQPRGDDFGDYFRDLRDVPYAGTPEPRRDPRSEIYGDRPFSGFVPSEQRHEQAAQREPAVAPPKDGFKRSGGKFRKWPGWARFLTAIGVLIVALVLTHLFFFQAFSVQSSAMAPTMQAGDRVLVNKIVYNFRDPKRGEIILFHGSSKWTPEGATDADSGIFSSVGSTLGSWVGISAPSSDEYFRRVIAVPGDTVACCDVNGHVTVNGAPLNETYVVNDSPVDVSSKVPACGSRYFDPVVVGAGDVFVMGDNRVNSLDSRCLDQVPVDKIVGRATAKVWGSWGPLPVPSTFNNVPKSYSLKAPSPAPLDQSAGLVVAMPLLLGFGAVRARHGRSRRRGALGWVR
jgi:signal peptidase I